MWLQLMDRANAEPTQASARVDRYADGAVSVTGPSAAATVPVGAWTVDAGWSSDFVSGATPLVAGDAISSATRYEDQRQAPTLAGARSLGEALVVRGSYAASLERDFSAHVLGFGGSAQLLGNMATLRLDWHGHVDRAGRADDPSYAEDSLGQAWDLGWTHILGRSTTATALTTGSWDACSATLGCQANPYRTVWVDGVVLPEAHPDARGRAALAGRVAHAFGPDTSVRGGYRFYADTWRISGHTVDVSLARAAWDQRLTARARGRWSTQTAASFWARTYSGTPRYRTGDPGLGGLTSWSTGLSLEWALFGPPPFSRLAASGHLDRAWLTYATATRDAWVTGGGIDAEF